MAIEVQNIDSVFKAQRAYFASGATRPYTFRKQQIKKLRDGLKLHESKLLEALHEDLAKPEFEAYGSEIGFLYNEISHTLSYLKEWMEPEKVSTSIAHFPTKSRVYSVPKGQTLILAPWNYPLMLLLNPLLGAMSAGNTAILKLPWQTPKTSLAIDELISETFDTAYISCISIEDEDIIPRLVQGLRFDHIFFTGSTRVAKLLSRAAADQLIPLTLELGGKSPAIVDETANLEVSARRIIWGKAFNAGQTCVAPDYVLVHQEVKVPLMHHLEVELDKFMSNYDGLKGFPRIVNVQRFEALLKLLKGVEGIYGGDLDADDLKLGLSLVDEPEMDSPIMKEEIFGPILPVVSYQNEADLKEKLSQNSSPLSFYLFSSDKKLQKRLIQEIPFGGGCINNCLIHLSNAELPFGGIGTSGSGIYHGKHSFDLFSHKKSIMKTGTWIDLPIRYAPYDAWKTKVIRFLFK